MHELARLGAFVASLRHDRIPADVRRAARLQIANMVAAVHGAASDAAVVAMARAAGEAFGAGKATALLTGQKLSPSGAAVANALAAMTHDFDDILWMGHTCHSAVFAALAVAEQEGSSAEDLVTAVVAANEVAGRLGASTFLGPLNGQMVTHIHLIGGAAAAARLLGLDAERATHALAISLAQPTFPLQPAFLAPTSKLLSAATPTATGLQAAYFARAGMTGASDLLGDRRGFWKRFAFLPLPFMLDGLGELWVLRTLTLKDYPGCHFFQTAGSAIDQILARTGKLDPAAITRVEVATTKLGAEVDRFGGQYAPAGGAVTPVNVNFQLGVTCALHLIAGRLTTDEMDPAWLAASSPAIRALAARVEVRHDPALTAEVLGSGRALGSGRRALSLLGPREILALARRYRDEYASSLITADELIGWVRLAGRLFRPAAPPPGDGPIPLRFPNRVTLSLRDGRREEAEVMLPAGSLAAPTVDAVIEAKFLHETRKTLGVERGRAALAACFASATTVPGLVAHITA